MFVARLEMALPVHNSVIHVLGFVINLNEIFIITLQICHVRGTFSILPGAARALLPTLEEVTQIFLVTVSASRSQIQLQFPAR